VLRCFLKPEDWTGAHLTLSREETRHLCRARRARPGDFVTVLDGQGRQALARLAALNADGTACLRLLRETDTERSGPAVTLLQCVPKARNMDFIVQKAVELGAGTIVPVLSERVVSRPSAVQATRRHARWGRVAEESAKQSGAPWVPAVEPLCALADALAAVSGRVRLVGSLEPDAQPLRRVLGRVRAQAATGIAVLIGPEGDLTEQELSSARAAGFVPVSLGHTVLRVETAAVFVLSVLAYEFGR